LDKLKTTFHSFKTAFEEFSEQSGLLYIHLNKTDQLQTRLKIIDQLGLAYFVDLDRVPFIIQKKARLIFPVLESLIENRQIDSAKNIVSNLINLIAERVKNGLLDDDPILERNYGLIDEQIVHIDIGRLIKDPEIASSKAMIRREVIHNTESLNDWLKNRNRELYIFYQEQIENL
jgi:hypothetical protein